MKAGIKILKNAIGINIDWGTFKNISTVCSYNTCESVEEEKETETYSTEAFFFLYKEIEKMKTTSSKRIFFFKKKNVADRFGAQILQ